jgi:outer membrane protein TolC
MRHPLSQIFRAIPFAAVLASPALVSAQAPAAAQPAQAAPTAPATPAAEKPPIEEFDLDKALVSDQGGLTADEAGQRARARSLQVKSAEAAATSAEWDAKNAWYGFLPQLQLYAQYKRINEVQNSLGGGENPALIAAIAGIDDPDARNAFILLGESFSNTNFTQPLNNYSLGAGLKVPVSDMFLRVWPAHESAKHGVEARKLQAQATGEQVELATKIAFYDYANAVAQKVVQEQALAQAEALAAQTKLFVDAGTKAPVEYMQAKAVVEDQRGNLARIEGSIAIARARLAVAMGVDNGAVQSIGEPITELPAMPTQPLNELIARGIEHRTELRALEKALGMNHEMQKSERNAAYPQLVLEANTLYANPNPRYVPPVEEFNNTWDVGASLIWSPNQVFTGKARSGKFGAEAAKARADLEAMREQVQVEVVMAYENLRAASAAAEASRAGVEAAEEAYRVRLATYRVGAGVLIDLVQADNQVTMARSKYIQYVIQARMALAQLRRNAAL